MDIARPPTLHGNSSIGRVTCELMNTALLSQAIYLLMDRLQGTPAYRNPSAFTIYIATQLRTEVLSCDAEVLTCAAVLPMCRGCLYG